VAYRILVPLDGSKLAEGAISIAVDLARRSKGALQLVRVHTPVMPIATVGDLAVPFYDPAWDDQLRKIARSYLDTVAAKTRRDVGCPVTTAVCDGAHIPDEIERAAAAFSADLIVMTTHGHGGSALAWLGSIADGVVRSTHRLVLVVPERAAPAPFKLGNVLVALDGSASSASVVAPAAELARLCEASLTLVRVVAPPIVGDMLTAITSDALDRFGIDRLAESAKTELDAVAAPLRTSGLKVEATVIVHPNPARALIEHIEQTGADLVAMGTHGRGMSRLFVGSVVDKVLRGSGRPSLIRRPAPGEAR
jgi:nucleotide-binding universal stress UspA family protein